MTPETRWRRGGGSQDETRHARRLYFLSCAVSARLKGAHPRLRAQRRALPKACALADAASGGFGGPPASQQSARRRRITSDDSRRIASDDAQSRERGRPVPKPRHRNMCRSRTFRSIPSTRAGVPERVKTKAVFEDATLDGTNGR